MPLMIFLKISFSIEKVGGKTPIFSRAGGEYYIIFPLYTYLFTHTSYFSYIPPLYTYITVMGNII